MTELSMIVRFLAFFLVAMLVVGAGHRYVWARLVRDVALPAPWARVGTVALFALFTFLMAGFVAFRALPRPIGGPVMWVAHTWLGIMFFLVLTLGAADLVKLATTRGGRLDDPERRLAISRMFAGAAAVFGLGTSAAGAVRALGPVAVKRVRVELARLGERASGMRIVQLTDIHVGPLIGKDFVETIVAQVNALEPDVVVITGDLVDGSVEELGEHVAPLGEIVARHGVFFVTGNHEYYSGVDAWVAFLRDLGIRVLRNERVRVGGEHGFDLAGIDDWSHGARGDDLRRALEGRDPSRACVLLAHQPRGVDVADALGVDLQISGHTHGGQIFPWNLAVRLQQPFVVGLHRLKHAQIYVSPGTGYWGPPMRVGTSAEITEIELVAS